VTSDIQVKLSPGDTIGILGGGQLGRMLALAAARLGLKCHVYAPDPDSPAFDVVQQATCAEYADVSALELFANEVNVVTYEFENVPSGTAMVLAARRPVLPNQSVLQVTQDRLAEKDFINKHGIATARYADVSSLESLRTAVARIGLPAVLKTRRFGYDGKGQIVIRESDDLEAAWNTLGANSTILEGFVPFEREVSVVVARGQDGQVECFDVTENEHRDHILKTSTVPAAISDAIAAEAKKIAETLAAAFNYVGVMAVELFVVPCRNGAAGASNAPTLVVNEIAPRVHNSGHWTLDGASVSQFEQHIRAIAGWPLAPANRLGRVKMTNLIGSDIDTYPDWLAKPGTTVHIYGKGRARAGRKMGHITEVT
jgi:5-(carboxyamino)imidazole ribonucleotide synthase